MRDEDQHVRQNAFFCYIVLLGRSALLNGTPPIWKTASLCTKAVRSDTEHNGWTMVAIVALALRRWKTAAGSINGVLKSVLILCTRSLIRARICHEHSRPQFAKTNNGGKRGRPLKNGNPQTSFVV
jgi:hypothetical protein